MGDITNPAPSHERSEFLFFIDAFFSGFSRREG